MFPMNKKTQSLAGLVRQNLKDYEKRMSFGIRQSVFVDELKALGYENTNVKQLRKMICLARKKLGKNLISQNEKTTPEEKTNQISTDQTKQPETENKPKSFQYDGTKNIDKKSLI